MGFFRKNNGEQEKEVSTGAVFGYVLLGFAGVVVVAFILFMIITKFA